MREDTGIRDGIVGIVGAGWEETERQTESQKESTRRIQKGRKEGRWVGKGRMGGQQGMRLREKERDEINNELAPSEIRSSRVGGGIRDRGFPGERMMDGERG